MNTDDVRLFRSLDPPPGGVERFGQRLANVDAATQPMSARRTLVAGLATVLIAVVAIAIYRTPAGGDLPGAGEAPATAEPADLRGAPAFARLLGQPPSPTETRIAIDDAQVIVAEIPSTNSKIRIYQISNNQGGQR
jgi:hypothetical protein